MPRVSSGPKKGLRVKGQLYENCATIGFYTGWNQIVPDPKKSSKWFKKLCANQVQYGCQAGLKKEFKEFYLDLMKDLKFFFDFSIQEIPDITTVDPFRHPERTWPNLSIYVPAITCLDPIRRSYLRFKRSLIEPRQTHLDTQSALDHTLKSSVQ